MKAKFTSKSVISMILSLVMVLSMVTVGLIAVTSAEVEVADEGASVMEVWFTKPNEWGTVKLHYWGGSSSTEWPGADMEEKYTNDYGQKVYYKTIPSGTTGIIFNNNNGTQTADLNVAGKQVVAYYWNGSAAVAWDSVPAPQATEPAPTTPPATSYTVYLADNTDTKWVGNDDARIYVGDTELKKSIDEHTGWRVWYGNVNIANNSSITFKRVSAIDKTKVWNSWTGTFTTGSPCCVVSGNGGENDRAMGTAPTIPAGTATDYWYGIWADTKGNGDVKDFVKIYAPDYSVSNAEYYLYLPSYVDLTNLTVYTSLYNLTIGGISVPRATAKALNLSSGSSFNINYKRYDTANPVSGKLHVMKTSGTCALVMTTDMELCAGKAAAYAVKTVNNAEVADYEGVAAYKSIYSTKGSYRFYQPDGTQLNTDEGIKKIKGRGNSTFEASMRLYGKYALNVTLNEKAQLIEGCKSSKKYSLLANNADETNLRNVTVYGIADEIGMPYTPNTRLVDVFDNGNYIGAYVLTEKVEYGSGTLIPDAKSADKANEDILAAGKGIDYDALQQKTATYTTSRGNTYTYQYSYNPSGAVYEYDGTQVTIGEGDTAQTVTLDENKMKQYDFLLEHEIETRYSVEPTWFRSSRTGQALVPKYPEFATKKQVIWMIEQYDALEDAAYDNDYTRVQEAAKVETFADVYLIQELTMNLDAGATSYYILGGVTYPKLVAAPLWDYDWAAGQYNGKKRTAPNNTEVDVADTDKVFVKNKSVSTGEDGRNWGTYNLQAQLCHQNDFWTLCKVRWTNKFIPALGNWLGDGKTLLGSKLPEFKSSANMNESRWGNLQRNYDAAHGDNPAHNTWGTRSTYKYKKGSYGFGVGLYYPTSEVSAVSYDNTIYYLNDWLTKRSDYMSSSMGLYDQSLYVEPTEAPTAAPTAAPTQAPTEAPTVAPTTAPTGGSQVYMLGDADGDGEVTILDATQIQRKLAAYSVAESYNKAAADADQDGDVSIIDATYIQRYLAQYSVTTPIGEYVSGT